MSFTNIYKQNIKGIHSVNKLPSPQLINNKNLFDTLILSLYAENTSIVFYYN